MQTIDAELRNKEEVLELVEEVFFSTLQQIKMAYIEWTNCFYENHNTMVPPGDINFDRAEALLETLHDKIETMIITQNLYRHVS